MNHLALLIAAEVAWVGVVEIQLWHPSWPINLELGTCQHLFENVAATSAMASLGMDSRILGGGFPSGISSPSDVSVLSRMGNQLQTVVFRLLMLTHCIFSTWGHLIEWKLNDFDYAVSCNQMILNCLLWFGLILQGHRGVCCIDQACWNASRPLSLTIIQHENRQS